MKTVKDLLVAMINATLILVALCLFLLWQLSGTAERVVSSFAQNLQIVKPLEEKVTGLHSEITDLRSDLASISLENTALNAPATQRLQARADALDAQLSEINASLASLAAAPDRLMGTAIDQASTRLSARLGDLASCYLPDQSAAIDTAAPNQ
ncbi:hypothetical protein J7382_04690 [Shimia sp. R11_0]|uniref:hypothetical protein n=1 Tax=Shimia sp. R11_0 TaxID=2821096 RepID=UPI001ADCA8B3|nr:hypothetical protein [Shimia sp. R11_0]MBO9476826.1 hypothetical protein [Shimia sp. R11_0]